MKSAWKKSQEYLSSSLLCYFPLNFWSWKIEFQNSSFFSFLISILIFTDCNMIYYDVIPMKYAAAAAKSLQSCLTLCDPIDSSQLGSPIPGILQARTLKWVAISFSRAWKWKGKMKPLHRVQLLVTPKTAAYQALPSMGFSRQEYWSGLPLPPPMKYEEFIKSFFLVFLICHQTYTKWKLLNSNCRSIFGANWQELLCSSLSKFLEMPLDLKAWWGPALKTI